MHVSLELEAIDSIRMESMENPAKAWVWGSPLYKTWDHILEGSPILTESFVLHQAVGQSALSALS